MKLSYAIISIAVVFFNISANAEVKYQLLGGTDGIGLRFINQKNSLQYRFGFQAYLASLFSKENRTSIVSLDVGARVIGGIGFLLKDSNTNQQVACIDIISYSKNILSYVYSDSSDTASGGIQFDSDFGPVIAPSYELYWFTKTGAKFGLSLAAVSFYPLDNFRLQLNFASRLILEL